MTEIIIEFKHPIAGQELFDSLENDEIYGDYHRHVFTRKLVESYKGFKIEIFANEHPPPHFRVSYNGENANYSIKDCQQLNGNLKRYYKHIQSWHIRNKHLLIDKWNSTRPSDCPVGLYVE